MGAVRLLKALQVTASHAFNTIRHRSAFTVAEMRLLQTASWSIWTSPERHTDDVGFLIRSRQNFSLPRGFERAEVEYSWTEEA